MRMRPARPLDPPIDVLKSKSVDKKGNRTTTKKKKRGPRPPPTRARRKTIDPLRWGSMQLSGIFLDDNEDPPLPQGENTEVEDMLDVSDQTPSPCDDNTPPHASGAELDLAAERASALDLLGAIFGEASDDWGGAKSIDSDVEMAGIPHVTPGPLECTDFEIVPADHELRPVRIEEKKSAVDRQSEVTPTPSRTNLAQPSTQNKLKDLFAPREQEGEFLTTYVVVSPHKLLHRLLTYRSPRPRLGARLRHGLESGRTRLPKCRSVYACGYVESQCPICALDATQGTRHITPAFLPAEGPRANGQVRTYRGRGGDPCTLGGGAWGTDARVETTASGSS
jgi:hypothetical protein